MKQSHIALKTSGEKILCFTANVVGMFSIFFKISASAYTRMCVQAKVVYYYSESKNMLHAKRLKSNELHDTVGANRINQY